jgi:hypothetical protein
MNIEETLLSEHSKELAVLIADYVGENAVKFEELMKLFLGSKIVVHQRAAMAVDICVDRNPSLLYPYIGTLLDNLKNPIHDAVIRTTIRAFQELELPEEIYGEVWDLCFGYLTSSRTPVAIRVYSMTVLANICQKLPELKHELKIVIEDQLPFGSAGFVNRGNKILSALE